MARTRATSCDLIPMKLCKHTDMEGPAILFARHIVRLRREVFILELSDYRQLRDADAKC
jgi:hypothetical protein